MKHEKVPSLLCGALLAFLLSFSCTACIATAFELPAAGLADLRQLALWCGLLSLACGICCSFRFGGILSFVLLAASAAYLWFYGDLALSVEALCNTISIRYHRGYHWAILCWSGADLQAVDRTMALQAIGSFVAMVTAWTVCKRRIALWAILTGLLPLISCTILTTTVPAKAALFLWLLALSLLLLTQPVRRKNANHANKLTLFAAIPAILALVLLFRLIPQEGYTGADRAARLLQRVESYFTRTVSNVGGGRDETVKLSRIGRMTQDPTPVMDVTATYSGACYLRGRAYDIYTGTQWQDSGIDYGFTWPVLERGVNEVATQPRGSITIRTRDEEDILYLPYYTESMLYQQQGNMQRNTDGLTEYSFDRYLLTKFLYHREDSEEAAYYTGLSGEAYAEYIVNFLNREDGFDVHLPDDNAKAAMTSLPEETRLWAQDWVVQIASMYDISLSDAYPDEVAAVIGSYLRSCAGYDLNTPRMAANQTDFVRWFLTQSDTGYCVHFASSAVVLLRAAGIPARYVSGFLVDTVAGETVTVQQKDAHAWVEYWTISTGWQVLDPTPAASDEIPTQPTTESTTVASTQPTTKPSESSSPSEPTTAAEDSFPGAGEPGEATAATQSNAVPFRILLWLAAAALLVALIVGQWRLRVHLRRRSRQRGTPNERALCCWQQVTLYCRALGEKPDPALRTLAQKAKFSQYELTDEELQQFERYFKQSTKRLRQKPLLLRLVYRLVFALY